jgi:hypothetical protein
MSILRTIEAMPRFTHKRILKGSLTRDARILGYDVEKVVMRAN